MSSFAGRVSPLPLAAPLAHRVGAGPGVPDDQRFELLKPWPLKIVIDTVLGGKPHAGRPRRGLEPGRPALDRLHRARRHLRRARRPDGAHQLHHHPHRAADGARPAQRPLRPSAAAVAGLPQPAQAGDLMYRVTADTFALQTMTMNCLFPATSALVLLGRHGRDHVPARPGARPSWPSAVCPLLLVDHRSASTGASPSRRARCASARARSTASSSGRCRR